jgi:hypothetical protein
LERAASDVSTTINKLEAKGFESLIGPWPIFRVADEDAFGRFGEVARFQTQALEANLPVVGIPGLDDLRVAHRGGQRH